ncbi:MAG: type I-E CRISPR-associated endoribonuclease Cas2 [Spirochaetaceae bacterium]|nr:type I-E CRISPR-associated endoribonuclease Cas2 [Spirochaetaceae bacterium]
MLVIVTENVPLRLRGYLARFLLEIRAGVYIGDYSVKVREVLWKTVKEEVFEGNAIIAWSTNTESGYDFDTYGGNRRFPLTIDGFPLVGFFPKEDSSTELFPF